MTDDPQPSDAPKASPIADAMFDAIQPRPGKATPWPPTADQRGLASPYPPGGVDPDPDAGQRQDRYYLRLLVAMILLIVLSGFAVTFIGLLLGFASPGAD
jgi:hypothetical protein